MSSSEPAFLLGVLAGALIIVGSVAMYVGLAFAMPFMTYMCPMCGRYGGPMGMMPFAAALLFFPILGLASGALVMYSALRLREGRDLSIWGAMLLAFSLIALFAGGGFLVGSILGILAGAIALAQRETARAPAG
jgi:hypothetical protein